MAKALSVDLRERVAAAVSVGASRHAARRERAFSISRILPVSSPFFVLNTHTRPIALQSAR